MKRRILKVKEWLKYSKPDYDGFLSHLQVWEEEGIPHSFKDLLKLAKHYNTPIPTSIDENGILQFDIKLTPKQTLEHVNVNINILPSEKN